MSGDVLLGIGADIGCVIPRENTHVMYRLTVNDEF